MRQDLLGPPLLHLVSRQSGKPPLNQNEPTKPGTENSKLRRILCKRDKRI